MTTNNPITVNGDVYPLFSANLAISSFYKNGQFEASAAMRLVPTRLNENGDGVTLDEYAKNILIGSTNDISELEFNAMQKIYNAVQEYLILKNL